MSIHIYLDLPGFGREDRVRYRCVWIETHLKKYWSKTFVTTYLKFKVFVVYISYFVDMERAQLNYVNKAPPKKKRKSRTAFTNHQIFELEKRFLYQKYLSPADRDEIAAHLGLTNAQVAFLIFG